jgi:competence protein ComEC
MHLIWISFSFIIGTWLGSLFEISAGTWVGIAAVILLGFFLFKRVSDQRRIKIFGVEAKIIIFVLIAMFLGAARFSGSRVELDANHTGWYNDIDDKIFIEGVIYKFPDERDNYINLYIEVERFGRTKYGMRPAEGRVLLKVPRYSEMKYGDKILFTGKLVSPGENEQFSYKEYLSRKGVFSIVYYPYILDSEEGYGNPVIAWLGEIREKGISLIYQFLPVPEASLLTGIVLGYESGIEENQTLLINH